MIRNHKNISHTISLIVLSLIVSSCGGRQAHPTLIDRPGDIHMSCNSLNCEMSEIESKIKSINGDNSKVGKNVALAAAGVFLIVPFFFMDATNPEQIEVEALESRYNHLLRMHADKCAPKTA